MWWPVIIIALMCTPLVEASVAKSIVHVNDKKLTQKQTATLKKAVKQKKCYIAVDKKTKQQYYVCKN